MTYRAPVRDLAFTLEAVAGMADVAATGAFPDYDADVAAAVLEAAGQFSEEVLAPLNRIGDQKGSTYADGAVTAARIRSSSIGPGTPSAVNRRQERRERSRSISPATGKAPGATMAPDGCAVA